MGGDDSDSSLHLKNVWQLWQYNDRAGFVSQEQWWRLSRPRAEFFLRQIRRIQKHFTIFMSIFVTTKCLGSLGHSFFHTRNHVFKFFSDFLNVQKIETFQS